MIRATRLGPCRFRFVHSAKNQRGQGQTEYILLIGLLSIAILGGLIAYRGAVRDLICRVIVVLGGNSGDCGSPSAPNPPPVSNPVPPPAAAPPPAPTPAAAPIFDPGLVEGRPCFSFPKLNVRISRTGPNSFGAFRIDPNGGGPPPESFKITVVAAPRGGQIVTVAGPDGRVLGSVSCNS